MRDERDDSLEKVLKAMGQVRVPEGLEARVAARLRQRVDGPEFRWRDVFAGSAAAGVWWRGALSGAMVAMVLVGAVMLAGHLVRGAAVGAPRSAAQEVMAVGMTQPRNQVVPCAVTGMLRASHVTPANVQREQPRIAISARSISAYEPALTKQERGLVRVARIGDLRELATLNPEVRERLEAEEAAQFQSFFAPPPKVVSTDAATDAAASTQTPEPAAADPGAIPQPSTDTNNGQN